MKNTNICPKCKNSSIKKIAGKTYAFGVGNTIPTGFKNIPVSRYICCNCGYVEEWIDSASDINKLSSM
ncbi:hypothetical protein SFC55_18950 [Niallia taxi]|uniref:hypothetical protein n=1 Tax=Niallia taxi TaxID=2499688 RepID=UPI0039825592